MTYLRSALDAEIESRRRADHLVAGLMDRVPDLSSTIDDASRTHESSPQSGDHPGAGAGNRRAGLAAVVAAGAGRKWAMNDARAADEGRATASLSPDEETQLAAVMVELGRLTTPGLIFESARLRLPDVPAVEDKTRFRMAYAGVIAATKIESYMVSMREANRRRLELGKRIRDLNNQVRELRLTNPMAAVEPAVMIPKLAGLQEVEIHTFVVAINAIQKLLPHAARAAGYKLSAMDRRTLLQFEPLRDFYEHIEQRLPGSKHKHKDQAFRETDDATGWRMIFELPIDASGLPVIDGKSIDVSSRGVSKIQDVAERTWTNLRSSALADAEKFFRHHPDRIPDARMVDSGFETKAGGPLGQVELFTHEGELFEQVGGIYIPVRQ